MGTFPKPSEIFETYKSYLKSIKPSLNVNDANSDFIIRGKAVTGLMSGLYGDQKKVDDDTYISSARPESLSLHGQDLGIAQQPATKAQSPQVRITGTNGTLINAGDLTFMYGPTSVLYTNVTGGTIGTPTSGQLDLQIQALVTGQIGDVAAPDTLQVVSPPSGVNNSAAVIQSIADGSDIESTDSYRARLLLREQSPPAGGNETDYPEFAFEADPSVRSVSIHRFGRGLGTVDVYITTGTTDIDTAVTNGLPIVRIPSSIVLANVQAYYDAHVPLTDCAEIFAPVEVLVDATVKVDLAAGYTLSTIPVDPVFNPLNLTVLQLIKREVGRVMYKVPVGGRLIPGFTLGFVTAGDIEEGLDVWLSAVKDPNTGSFIGKIPILADRQCQPLDPPNTNKTLNENELAKPGTITVQLGT